MLIYVLIHTIPNEIIDPFFLSIDFEYILKSACAISMDTKYYMCYKTLDPSMLPSKTTPFHYDRKSVVPHYGCHVP